MTVTRRTALKGLGAIAGTAAASHLLPACASSPPATTVYMMMENRTYDHFLGSRSLLEGLPGDGLTMGMTNPDMVGAAVGLSVPPVTPAGLCVLDPPHDWDAARIQFNNGKNDGFVKAFQGVHAGTTGDVVMEYMTRQHLPVFYALADAYTTCDRWFASVLGPTLPNRLFWLGATSNGAKGNLEILNGAYKGLVSIFDRMDAAGVDWAFYYGDVSVLGFLPQFMGDSRIKFYSEFLTDAKKGKLPSVVYIDPSYTYNDYHPPHYPLVAEQLIASTYQALATSPQWASSMMVVTFDEHGGFHDHVAPGKTVDERASEGFDQLGFRVPALIVGPNVKKGYVCSTPLEHTSALKHIENQFKLQPLTMRDAASTDLSSCIMSEPDGAAPITLPNVEVDETQLLACGGKAFDDEHIILKWGAAEGLDMAKAARRAKDGVYEIGEYLDKHNLGRIRRGR